MGLARCQSGLLTIQAGLKQSSSLPFHSISFKGLFCYRIVPEAVVVVFDPCVWNAVLLPHLVFFVGTDCLLTVLMGVQESNTM